MPTTLNTSAIIKEANDVADNHPSRWDAAAIRAATHRLKEMQTEVNRLRTALGMAGHLPRE